MAVGKEYLPFLDACSERGGIQSPLWVLGSQEVKGSTESVEDLLVERYGVDEYVDFDLNDEAKVRLDFTRPLPDEFAAGAGTVLEAGTIEHIFDLRSVFETVHRMIRPGGTLVALSPVTWWDHAFVNMNPRLYRGFAAANGYDVVYESLVFRVPFVGDRYVDVALPQKDARTRASRWVPRIMNRLQPAKTIYGCCLRKREDSPFRVPVDVFGASIERSYLGAPEGDAVPEVPDAAPH